MRMSQSASRSNKPQVVLASRGVMHNGPPISSPLPSDGHNPTFLKPRPCTSLSVRERERWIKGKVSMAGRDREAVVGDRRTGWTTRREGLGERVVSSKNFRGECDAVVYH
jgi:hypothetical protein